MISSEVTTMHSNKVPTLTLLFYEIFLIYKSICYKTYIYFCKIVDFSLFSNF